MLFPRAGSQPALCFAFCPEADEFVQTRALWERKVSGRGLSPFSVLPISFVGFAGLRAAAGGAGQQPGSPLVSVLPRAAGKGCPGV